jgi:hypothetical protein
MRNFENRIVETLRNEGIKVEAEEIEIVKNGIPCKGIRICKEGSNICPVVYYSEQDTYEQIMFRIQTALESDVPHDSIKLLNDLNYVRNNVFLAVQKQSKEEIVKKEYLNLELFMRIMLDLGGPAGAGSVKVTPGLVAQLSIMEDDLWDYAAANSLKEASIRSMAEVLGLPDTDGEQSLYVATTGQLTGGASVLYFPEIFHAFCEDHGEEACYMLPSSTEEILVLRETSLDNGRLTVNDLVRMVETINEDQVDPILQLEPAVYRYSIDSDEINVVATL